MGAFHSESQGQLEGLTTQEGTSLVPKLLPPTLDLAGPGGAGGCWRPGGTHLWILKLLRPRGVQGPGEQDWRCPTPIPRADGLNFSPSAQTPESRAQRCLPAAGWGEEGRHRHPHSRTSEGPFYNRQMAGPAGLLSRCDCLTSARTCGYTPTRERPAKVTRAPSSPGLGVMSQCLPDLLCENRKEASPPAGTGQEEAQAPLLRACPTTLPWPGHLSWHGHGSGHGGTPRAPCAD